MKNIYEIRGQGRDYCQTGGQAITISITKEVEPVNLACGYGEGFCGEAT